MKDGPNYININITTVSVGHFQYIPRNSAPRSPSPLTGLRSIDHKKPVDNREILSGRGPWAVAQIMTTFLAVLQHTVLLHAPLSSWSYRTLSVRTVPLVYSPTSYAGCVAKQSPLQTMTLLYKHALDKSKDIGHWDRWQEYLITDTHTNWKKSLYE